MEQNEDWEQSLDRLGFPKPNQIIPKPQKEIYPEERDLEESGHNRSKLKSIVLGSILFLGSIGGLVYPVYNLLTKADKRQVDPKRIEITLQRRTEGLSERLSNLKREFIEARLGRADYIPIHSQEHVELEELLNLVYEDGGLDLDQRIESARAHLFGRDDSTPDLPFLYFINNDGDYVKARTKAGYGEDSERFVVKGFNITERLPKGYFDLGYHLGGLHKSFSYSFRTEEGDYIVQGNHMRSYFINKDGRVLTEPANFLLKKEEKIIAGIYIPNGSSSELIYYEDQGTDTKVVREIVDMFDSIEADNHLGKINFLRGQGYSDGSIMLAREVIDGKFHIKDDGLYVKIRET